MKFSVIEIAEIAVIIIPSILAIIQTWRREGTKKGLRVLVDSISDLAPHFAEAAGSQPDSVDPKLKSPDSIKGAVIDAAKAKLLVLDAEKPDGNPKMVSQAGRALSDVIKIADPVLRKK